MREYFEAEMRLLQDAAADFARAHPEQARMLNLTEVRDRDPYVERLLEGMAFMAAQIRARIDDSEVAVSEQLLEQLCPGQLRGSPSGTLLAFTPDTHAQQSKTVAAGSRVSSARVGDDRQSCQFSTLMTAQVQPLAVKAVTARETADGGTTLSITIDHVGGGDIAALALTQLDFFLHADHALALALFQGLTEKPGEIQLYADSSTDPFATLPGSALSAPGLDSQRGETDALPHHRGNPGFDLLQDYFSWRDRFLFVRLAGPAQAWHVPDKCSRLRIVIPMALRLPVEHQLKAENLRLNCVPARNLYSMDADPLEVDQRRAEYRFLPDKQRPDTVVLHHIEELLGREQKSARVRRFRPFYQAMDLENGEHCYRLTHRDLGLATPQPFISLSGPALIDQQTLSARVTVSDGYLPRRYLAENQITAPGDGIPSGITVTNITRPTSYLPCPPNTTYRWQLQALMQLPVGGLASREGLRTLLGLLDWTGREEHRRRRQAVQEVVTEPVTRMLRGMLYRGLAITVHLSEQDFLSHGDIYLFGCVLHRVLSLSAAINESVELRVIAQPGQREFIWEPRPGCAAPI